MATKTFHPVNNDKAGDAINWTPSGAPAPGDTLILPSGPIYLGSEGGDLAGDTLMLGVTNATSSVAIDMRAGATLTTTTVSGCIVNAEINVAAKATLQLGQSNPDTANYTVNIASGGILQAGYNMAINGSIKVNAAPGALFENDGISNNAGMMAVINADVIGVGSFTDGIAYSHLGFLEFGRSVAATETVNLRGDQERGNVTLAIDSPKDFHAAITLYDGTIDLKGITADSYNYDGTTLSLVRSGAVVNTLRLQNTTTNGQPDAPIEPLYVSQNGSDVQIFAGAGVPPSNLLPLFQPPQTPTVTNNFLITDTSTGTASAAVGEVYTGPVAGLQHQFINLSPDNLAIAAVAPNSFIHSGAGTDSIDVSRAGGNNVLDGSTGSNFLVGGTGNDTFFVDNRAAAADIWSTVVNFHSGGAVTIFGVTPTGFSFDWEDNQGAVGSTGLTLHATASGKPTASMTLAGYTSADLSNGRLGFSFGNDVAGNPYLYVHGT